MVRDTFWTPLVTLWERFGNNFNSSYSGPKSKNDG